MPEKPPTLPRRLVKAQEAARYIGMSPDWLKRQVKLGHIASVRLTDKAIRYDVADLDALIDAGRRGPDSAA
jgi:hypothetical protein